MSDTRFQKRPRPIGEEAEMNSDMDATTDLQTEEVDLTPQYTYAQQAAKQTKPSDVSREREKS